MSNLYTQYNQQENLNPPFGHLDWKIRNIIEAHESEDFTDILKSEERWEVFYHLSELRTGILSWYEFKKESSLLEIGGEFGALTGMFCDRCARVTVAESSLFRAQAIRQRYHTRENLDIYAGEMNCLSFEEQFDYITLIGSLEWMGQGFTDKEIYEDKLRQIVKWMKPDGKLLISVENRYGLRYLCGAEESHTGIPFDGLNHYPNGTAGYSFTRKEIQDIVIRSGLDVCKFYYPLPDYKLTQLIYTDQYLPEKNLQERLIPYCVQDHSFIAEESSLYEDVIDNQVFPFVSNSFLVESGWVENFSPVIYAAVSTDRGRRNGFATTIRIDGTVKKQCLYQEGEETVAHLYENIQDLKHHGIPVVAHRLYDHALLMPFVKAKTLSIYMRELIQRDKKEFVCLLDQLQDYIWASSRHLPPERNAMLSLQSSSIPIAADWGIILEKAYLELIPLNCFYQNGNFLFFDQEFIKECYPAKYIMFRAIHYIYAFAPAAHEILPIEDLKIKYGLQELWTLFCEEEERFLHQVRRHELYPQFYRWTQTNRKHMQENARLLSYPGEFMKEYQIQSRIHQIQKAELTMVEVFQEVCERHGIRYFIFFGTLLGAVRHKGFIPWDDDIDMVLPREDYNRLLEIAPLEFQEPYVLQTPDNDSECFYGGYSKLRNSNTTAIEMINWGHQCNQGMWMDIFPLDSCCEDPVENQRKQRKICHYQRLLFAKTYKKNGKMNDLNFLFRQGYRFAARFIHRAALCRKLNEVLCTGEESAQHSSIFAIYTGRKEKQIFHQKDFQDAVLLEYEHLKLPAPVGYQNCLEQIVGKEYLRFPPFEERVPHHPAFYAPNVPYKAYITRFTEAFQQVKDKTIVLFGSGLMSDDYRKKHGRSHPPAFMVDNDRRKWGTLKRGIPIQSPEMLLQVEPGKLHLIICNIYYREIETQIRRMGIHQYYIYVQNKEWLTGEPTDQATTTKPKEKRGKSYES